METKTVRLKIPLTRTQKDDVYVCVNGSSWLIERGKEVELPWYAAKILERQEKMLSAAMQFEEQAAEPLARLEEEASL